MAEATNVRVVCRFRPFNQREIDCGEAAAADELLKIVDGVAVQLVGQEHGMFQYDRVFGQNAMQADVYNEVAAETVANVMDGYNGTIFAYGQTGAGKSFSMFGKEHSTEGNLKGIIPRAAADLFGRLEEAAQNDPNFDVTEVKCSFLEIYKEKLKDLLNPNGPVLKVRESPHKGVWVDGLVAEYVTCEAEVMEIIGLGEKNRHTAATAMNEASSRSHSVFILETIQKFKDGSTKSGKLCLADLAGSERVKRSKVEGLNLEEAAMINKSLSALGNCINALTQAGRDHIPFRDSKLTYVLRESLGGNSRTTLLVACSPHISSHEETVSTLRFAERAKTIKCSVKQNKLRSVEELTALVEKLETTLKNQKRYIKGLEELLEQHGIDCSGVKSQCAGATAGNLVGVVGLDSKEVREMGERLEHLEAEKADLLSAIEELKNNSATVTDAIQETMNELEVAARSEQEAKEKVIAEATAEAEKLNGLILEEKEKYEEANAEKDALLELLEEKEEEVQATREELEAQITQLKASDSTAVKEISALQEQLDASNNALSSLRHELAQLNTTVQQSQLELTNAQEEIARSKTSSASKDTELSELLREKDLADAKIAELTAMQQQLKDESAALSAKQLSTKEALTQSNSEAEQLLGGKRELEAKLNREVEEKAGLLEDLKKEKDKIELREQQHQEEVARHAASAATSTSQLEQLQQLHADLQAQLAGATTENTKLESAMTIQADEVKELKRDLEAKTAAIESLETTVGHAEGRVKSMTEERDGLSNEIQKMREEKTASALALRKAKASMGDATPRDHPGAAEDLDESSFDMELTSIMEKNDSIQKELTQSRHELSEATSAIDEFKHQLESAGQEKTRLGDANKILQEEVYELREELEQAKLTAAQKVQEAEAEHRKQASALKKESSQEIEAKNEEVFKINREIARLKQELDTALSEGSTEKDKRLQLAEQLALSQGDCERQKHDIVAMEAKMKHKKERKGQLKAELSELHEKQAESRRSLEQLNSDLSQSKAAHTRAKDESKRLQDENSALNIKVQTEMASLAFWLQDHKDLTAEMEEERVIHKARVHKLEDRLGNMEEQLSKANDEKREAQKHVRDDLRQIKMLEKETKKRKASEDKLTEMHHELRTKMEVQGKLLNVQTQRMAELEKTARAAEEMVTAWKKHSEVIEMERDEALAQAAAVTASNGTKSGSLLGRYVRGISKK